MTASASEGHDNCLDDRKVLVDYHLAAKYGSISISVQRRESPLSTGPTHSFQHHGGPRGHKWSFGLVPPLEDSIDAEESTLHCTVKRSPNLPNLQPRRAIPRLKPGTARKQKAASQDAWTLLTVVVSNHWWFSRRTHFRASIS